MNEEIDIYLFKSIIYVSKAADNVGHQDILDILTHITDVQFLSS